MAKENNFTILKQQIREKNPGRMYLLYGEEVYLKETYLARLSKLVPDGGFADFNRIVLDGKSLTPEKADDALESFPMMSEKKLVLIQDSGIFKSANAETKEYWTKRLADIPDYVMLIFDEKEVDKRSALYKTAAKAGLDVEFTYIQEYELVAWVEREAGKAGKKITKDNAQYLIAVCDPGLASLNRELDKLIHYCGEEIYRTDIDKVVSKAMHVQVFALADRIAEGNADGAMQLLADLETAREPAFKLLYLLFASFDKMLHCKLMLAEGASPAEVAKKVGIAPFLVNKYAGAARKLSNQYLADRVAAVAQIDMAIKSGEIGEWQALEQYVLDSLRNRTEK